MIRVLALGDIVGTEAISVLKQQLWKQRTQWQVDFVVANGENATDIHGLCARDAQLILDCGVDVITLGNHTYSFRDLYPFLEEHPDSIIRPANYPPECPGCGYTVRDVCGYRLLCINVNGTVFIDALANPFDTVSHILEREAEKYDLALLDIHAEATSEKLALARVFDGRITAMFGTHTHVATADEQILPRGSGYITDLGMTGPTDGILGTDAETVITKFRTHMPQRFTVAQGPIRACGALFEIDPDAGKCLSVRRVTF